MFSSKSDFPWRYRSFCFWLGFHSEIFFFFQRTNEWWHQVGSWQRSLGLWGAVQHVCVNSIASDSLQPHELYLSRFLCPWNFPGRCTGAVAIFYSRVSSTRDWTGVLCLAGEFFTTEQPGKPGREFSSVQSRPTLWPHESLHARPPCPSPIPGVHSNSCPSSQWCHPAISSFVIPFSSCPQSLPASESFPVSQLFAWGGQSTGVSALASFLPKNTQGWSHLQWTGWISLQIISIPHISDNNIFWLFKW